MSDQYTVGDNLDALESWLSNIAGGHDPLYTGETPVDIVSMAARDIVHHRKRAMDLKELCERAIEIAEHGDYRNGVTCEAGTSDEGAHGAFQAIEAIKADLEKV